MPLRLSGRVCYVGVAGSLIQYVRIQGMFLIEKALLNVADPVSTTWSMKHALHWHIFTLVVDKPLVRSCEAILSHCSSDSGSDMAKLAKCTQTELAQLWKVEGLEISKGWFSLSTDRSCRNYYSCWEVWCPYLLLKMTGRNLLWRWREMWSPRKLVCGWFWRASRH